MELVFASASAFANNPRKFYIRIGIRTRGCCRWNLRIDIRIRTLSAINIRIRIRIRNMQRRIIEYLVILVYTIQNASDFLHKKQKSNYLWKKNLPIFNFKYLLT